MGGHLLSLCIALFLLIAGFAEEGRDGWDKAGEGEGVREDTAIVVCRSVRRGVFGWVGASRCVGSEFCAGACVTVLLGEGGDGVVVVVREGGTIRAGPPLEGDC